MSVNSSLVNKTKSVIFTSFLYEVANRPDKTIIPKLICEYKTIYVNKCKTLGGINRAKCLLCELKKYKNSSLPDYRCKVQAKPTKSVILSSWPQNRNYSPLPLSGTYKAIPQGCDSRAGGLIIYRIEWQNMTLTMQLWPVPDLHLELHKLLFFL